MVKQMNKKNLQNVSDIIVFVGMWFRKGDAYNAENLENYLLEKPLEEVTETIPLDMSGRDEPNSIWFNTVKFKEDCFAMHMESVISTSMIAGPDWGLQMMINEIGFDEVFKDFRTDLINLGKAQLEKINEPPKSESFKLDDIFIDLTLEQKSVSAVRVFTAWSFWVSSDGEDTEWDLVGIIDPNKIVINKL